MEVSLVQTAKNAYSNLSTKSNSKAFTESLANENRKKDSVKISEEAKLLSKNNRDNKNIGNQALIDSKAEQDLPLEAFALPGWYADLSPDYNLVDTEIGISYEDSNLARFEALSNKEKNDLYEYNSTLNGYFQKALQSRNINTSQEYYQSIVKNNEINESVHQEVRQQLINNPRMIELMKQFGIS
ncbi:hypothetical protein [Desulfogranum japonicum]|uniref:hypothetical protein n=1 Tax=Desulfogranum japonicum TaxID=231447 RepID=UPI00048C8AA3|nr:hypothetical protein [Desulfogranum japonicum]